MRYLMFVLALCIPVEAWACKGKLDGRYRIYFQDALTRCTIEIQDGAVAKQNRERTRCVGHIFGDVTGGKFKLHKPLDGGRCWMTGHINIGKTRIKIIEAFSLGRHGWTGWTDAGELFTMPRY